MQFKRINPLTTRMPKSTSKKKYQISFCKKIEEQVVPYKSTAKEVSFEWSHHRISFTDSKVRTTVHVSIIDFGSEWINNKEC